MVWSKNESRMGCRRMMADRENVISGLEIQLEDLKKYADNDQPLSLTQERAQEIIAMLKEQEQEIKFLKGMQLQAFKGMDENKLGQLVGETLLKFR